MFREKTLFTIDDCHDTHTVAKFLRSMDTNLAMKSFKSDGGITHCINKRYGLIEPAYLMDTEDFEFFVKDVGWIDLQEYVIRVPGDRRQPCRVDFFTTDYGDIQHVNLSYGLPPLRIVEQDTAMGLESWILVLETNTFFTTEPEGSELQAEAANVSTSPDLSADFLAAR